MRTRRPRIVVGCDGSPESAAALAWAVEYARVTDGSVSIVSAWQWPAFQDAPIVYGDWDPESSSRLRVNRLRTSVDLPTDRIDVDVGRGNPAHVLTALSAEADLLVMGSHGLGALSRLVLGSVSAYCATHAPSPVAIVHDVEPKGRRGVVVGVDDSKPARDALRWAMDYADLVHEPLIVVHVTEPPIPPVPHGYPLAIPAAREVNRTVRRWLGDLVAKEIADRGSDLSAGFAVRAVTGNPAHVLVAHSEHALVTVCGRRGAGGFRRLMLGSVAAALAHHAHSTLVVTPPAR